MSRSAESKATIFKKASLVAYYLTVLGNEILLILLSGKSDCVGARQVKVRLMSD